MNREKELLELKLLTAKGALARESTEFLIQSFFAALLRMWRDVVDSDESAALAWLRALLLAVVSAVCVYELTSAMKTLVLRGLAGEGGLSLSFVDPSSQSLPPSAAVAGEKGERFITWQSPARPQCVHLASWIRQARAARRMLPNVLFVGPAGCGKSHLARWVAFEAGAVHLAVCAGDLQALGDGAGPFLRRLLDRCSQRWVLGLGSMEIE